ncbi:MAG: EMC3/TMCO1 family protein [Nitrososphaeria archaeon]
MIESMVFEIVWNKIPYSTLLIVLTSLGLNIISQVATRFLVNVEESRRIAKEARQFRKELMDAVRKGDKAREEKLRKKEKGIREMELKSSNQRLKASFIFLIPFMLIFWFVSSIVGSASVVAYSPISLIVVSQNLELFWWYLITSFAFSTMISKLAGTSLD